MRQLIWAFALLCGSGLCRGNNDDYTNAAPIAAIPATMLSNNVGATLQPYEFSAFEQPVGASVWWRWNADFDGPMEINTFGSDFDTLLNVYTGAVPNLFSFVAANDDVPPYTGFHSVVQFVASSGTTYRISVAGFNALTGQIQLNLFPGPPPANDDFANAQTLVGIPTSMTGMNDHATTETGEPSPDFNPPQRTVWYRWTAPSNQSVEVVASRHTDYLALGVFTGAAVSTLGKIGGAEQEYPEKVRFDAEAGQTYAFSVGGGLGPFDLEIRFGLSRPANDDFANREVISSFPAVVYGNNVAATFETNEVDHNVFRATGSIWWEWTADRTDTVAVRIREDSSWYAASLLVYTGSSVHALGTIAEARFTEPAPFAVVDGETYTLAYLPQDEGQVAFDLYTHCPPSFPSEPIWNGPSPTNDHFENRIALTGFSMMVSGIATGASYQTFAAGYPAYDLWWSWTAPTTGLVVIDTGFDQSTVGYPEIFLGTSLSSLVAVTYVEQTAFANSWIATNGTTYQIRIVPQGGVPTVAFALFNNLSAPPNDDFTDRISITGFPSVIGTTHGATAELGEPSHHVYFQFPNHTVWWSWRAPASGMMRIEDFNNLHSGAAVVYTGTNLTTLIPAGSETVWGLFDGRQHLGVRFLAASGQVYQIAVEQQPGPVSFRLRPDPPAANDAFATPTLLTGFPVVVTSAFVSASLDPGETKHSSRYGGGKSIWFEWTAPTTQSADFFLAESSSYNLTVYTGSTLNALSPVVRPAFGNITRIPAVAGTRYLIALYGDIETTFELEIRPTPGRPPNDDFADRQPLTGFFISATGSLVNATLESNEPSPFDSFTIFSNSVWFTWTAPLSGRAIAEVEIPTLHEVVTVYRGNALNALTPEPRGTGDARSDVHVFDAVAGVAYHIVVGARAHYEGNYQLDLNLLTPETDTVGWLNTTQIGTNALRVFWAGFRGEAYEVEYSTNLTAWRFLTELVVTNPPVSVDFPMPADQQGYFRVLTRPGP